MVLPILEAKKIRNIIYDWWTPMRTPSHPIPNVSYVCLKVFKKYIPQAFHRSKSLSLAFSSKISSPAGMGEESTLNLLVEVLVRVVG